MQHCWGEGGTQNYSVQTCGFLCVVFLNSLSSSFSFSLERKKMPKEQKKKVKFIVKHETLQGFFAISQSKQAKKNKNETLSSYLATVNERNR